MFVIGGSAMSGKTYTACKFPNPILINTDGNCAKVNTPSIYINDKKYKTYKEKMELLFGVLKELNETETEYQTIIIDLIEDIFDICEGYVLEKYKVDNLSKVPGYATGYTERKVNMQNVISALKTLTNKYYVVVITHTVDKVVDDKMVTISMLKEDFYILLEGKADLVLSCKKLGNTYITKMSKYRNNYKDAEVQKVINKDILEVIKTYE
jgi:archaellum biogenesis ATPase FlaH